VASRQAEARGAARDQAARLSRSSRSARLRACGDRASGLRARSLPRSRAVVPHQGSGAGMGTSLWTRAQSFRPRSRAVSHRRGPQHGQRRLGAGRGLEKRRANRGAGSARDQDRACRTPSRPRRASLAHTLLAVVRPRAGKPSRKPDQLARRCRRKRAGAFRCTRAGSGLLAGHSGTLPWRNTGTEFHRGVQS